MSNIFGGFIEFETDEDLNDFIENVDKESALKIIEACVNYGVANGFYSLQENHYLYKCLNKLKETINQ